MLYRFVLTAVTAATLWSTASADAQTYAARKPRRQFVSISTDWLHTQPLHFLEYPLQDLVGRPVAAAQFQDYEYRTRDEAIQIDVLEFNRSGRGAGITVYPLGLSVGPAVGLRVSREDLPTIRITGFHRCFQQSQKRNRYRTIARLHRSKWR